MLKLHEEIISLKKTKQKAQITNISLSKHTILQDPWL